MRILGGIAVRVAIVLAVLFLAGAALATFGPSPHYRGADCESWISPGWDDARVTTTQDAVQLQQQSDQLTGEQLPDSVYLDAIQRADATQAACDDKLGTRRFLTFALVGLAIVVVPVALFITGGRRRSSDRDEVTV